MKGNLRGVAALGLVVVVVVATVVIGGGSGRPFDLESAEPSGYKGLRLVLEELGASVEAIDADELADPSSERFTALLVMGGSNPTHDQRSAIRSLAAAGRTVVAAGPIGGLGAGAVEPDTDDPAISNVFGEEVCDIEDLRVLGPIETPGYLPLVVADGQQSCLGDGRVAAVVSEQVEEGRVVTVATPWIFTNDSMRPRDQEIDEPRSPMPDNVVLAGRLLIRDAEGEPDRIAVVSGVRGGLPTAGEATLSDLLAPGVKLGLGQLLVAFVVYAWFRSRRVGRPVEEPRAVTIAGSELVAATGNFRERQGDALAAANLVRHDVARQLAERLGLPLHTSIEHIAAQSAARLGRDPDEVAGALWAWPVGSDDDLVRVTTALDAIRQEVTHV